MQIKGKESGHSYDINALLFHHHEFVYSGADDGKIIKWSKDLGKVCEVEAHPCSIYSLAAIGNTIYSCSNDGTIKSFNEEDLKQKSVLLDVKNEGEFWKMAVRDNDLFVGDDQGNILQFVDEKPKGRFETLEGVKDLKVQENRIYSGKDTDILITEFGSVGEKLSFSTRKVMQGRAPICLTAQYLIFVDHPATGFVIHENCTKSNFQQVTNHKGAHNMIINTLSGDKDFFYSGGWDKTLKKWQIDSGACKLIESIDVGIVINSIAISNDGLIYVGGGDGALLKLQQ